MFVVAFKNTESNFLSLLNFPHAKRVEMALLPQARKLGDEGENKRLFNRRIENSQRWLGHLPGSFNDEGISTMFLNIDPKIAM